MKKNNLKRFLASLLAVLMLASVTGVSPAVFADETAAPELVETSKDAPKEVLIKSTYTDEQVLSALANALLKDPTQVDANDLSWTYTCAVKGTYESAILKRDLETDSARDDTFSVLKSHQYIQKDFVYAVTDAGFLGKKEWKADVTYTYPALKDNTDGVYTLYLDGQTVYINKVAKYSSSVDFTAADINVPFNNDSTINYAELKERIMEKVVTTPADIDRSSIVLTYEASADLSDLGNNKLIDKIAELAGKEWMPIDGGSKKILGFDVPYFAMNVGENKIKLSWEGNDTYKGFENEFTVEFKDNRIATNIVVKENASITYNVDKDAMKQDIFDNVIDWAASTPTDKTALTYANFKFEYKGKDLANANLNADEKNAQEITISYSGDASSKPCKDVTASVIVKKADVKVSMNKFSKAYAGDEKGLSKEALGVTLTPDDDAIDIYMVFAGVNTNFDGSINLVLTDEQWAFIKKFSALEREIYDFVSIINSEYKDKPTLEDKLTDGITIGEFKQYVNDAVNALKVVAKVPGVDDILKKYNIDIDSIAAMVSIFTELDFADDTTIAFGVPKHAGMYRAYAIAVNKNYNTGYASGTVLILMNVKNVKIVMNEKFDKKMTVETAKEVAKAPALLQQNDVTVKDQSSLHYLYTGIQSNLKPYYSTTEFPTEPGRYVVTVVTLGGDYLAAPVTKSFQITK